MSFIKGALFHALMGVSSLFIHHVAVMPVVATSTPVLATTTTSTYLPPVLQKVLHTAPKPTAITISPAPVIVPVPAVATKILCPSGKEVQNGTCQWTQASLDAIATANDRMAEKQQAAATEARQYLLARIAALQASYDDDMADESVQDCPTTNYDRAIATPAGSFGGTEPVAEGRKKDAVAAAITKDSNACVTFQQELQTRIQGDEDNASAIQAQLTDLKSQL